MQDAWLFVVLGLGSGALIAAANRWPPLAWIALTPLGLTLAWASPLEAAIAAGLAGAIGTVPAVASRTLRSLVPITAGSSAIAWAAGFAIFAGLHRFMPSAAWLAITLPLASTLVLVPMRLLGAPRWVSSPLACSQEGWLAIVHTSRFGGDLTTHALLAEASACLCLALLAPHAGLEVALAALASALIVATGIAMGTISMRRAIDRVDAQSRVRVAAVVVDGAPPEHGVRGGLWPTQSTEYRDPEGTARRYQPHVARAVAEGARLVVLPEVSVSVDDETRDRWLEIVGGWARLHDIAIVAPFFDLAAPQNTLAIVDSSGVVAQYDKQHPGRGLEPPRRAQMSPGPHRLRSFDASLSTVICVDLDYGDLVRPVRSAGGLLVAPSNDWLDGFEERHHRTGVWAAVETGVTTLRATGHGISAMFDGAGRVIARASSAHGPVVLVVDAPVSRGAGFSAAAHPDREAKEPFERATLSTFETPPQKLRL